MAKTLKYFLLPAIIFFMFSCKKNSLIEPDELDSISTDTTKYFSVSGIMFDVVSKDYSPGLKRGAPVYMDKDSTTSDNEGKYIFNKVSKGNHKLSVTLAGYEPFADTIAVSKDTTINIYLYGVKDNYFPIQENTSKKYKYNSSAGNAVYSWNDSGEATWVITSSQQIGNSKVYNVSEKIIFTHKTYAPLYSEKVDSSFSVFTITESNTNFISFKSSVLDGISFNRLIDSRLEQGGIIILNFNSPGGLISTLNISLKKNVGIAKIVQFGNGWSKTYELIQ